MNLSRLRLFVFVSIISAAFLITSAQPGYTQTPAAAGPETKIAPWVLEHTANDQSAEFLVVLTEQANLNAAAQLPDKISKGSYVYNTLYRTAQTTQAPILAWLKARGIEHRSYYIVNLIWVKADRDTALALAARSDVARLDGNPRIRVIPDRPAAPAGPAQPDRPNAVESNITYVHAPDVWAMGFTGQGIVVGGQDTGYDWDHPALQPHYRGWNGSTASHNYNWHDSIHSGGGICGANSTVPCDDDQHGTHTMGTAVGDDGGANQIGMAPGAKWIGCRNMDVGVGTPATYLECFEFFLAPYPVGGTTAQGDPSKAPDVTNNSWGCPTSEGCVANSLLAAVQAQRAAGIMTVVSAGNDGPSCHTVQDPAAIYDEVYSVGALNTGFDTVASFSSRGSVTVDGSNRRKPDISAPGTSIRSSVPGGSYQSAGWSGTSMAGPHVAGAVALLWSARPALRHNIDLTEQILSDSAVHINSATCDTAGTTWPNNTYGYGRLDIKAAVDLTPAGNSYLSGTVTNANTAAPIVGATVTANATVTQTGSTTTITGGQYSLLLMANTYTVTAVAYGYQPTQLTGIAVVSGTTTTQNITLTPASFYLVSGTVSDAARGLPLTATLTIEGYPFGSVSTNPASGYYNVTLAEGRVYTFSVASPGYMTAIRTVGPLTTNRTEDFALTVDLTKCTAPGYALLGVSESFDAATTPINWTVVGSPGWTFNDAGGRGNLTGGTGNFAIADSDDAGSVTMNTELRSPVMNLTTLSVVTLTFKTDFRYYAAGGSEVADVDVSLNGAVGPWNTVWHKTADYRGPKTETINLTTLAAGQPAVMIRFRYYTANNDWWWQVDDVQLGQCKLQTTVNLPGVTPSSAAQSGNPGTVVTYTLSVSNTDSISHTFDVLVANHNWPTNAATPIGPVAAQAAKPITITVAIPGDASAHDTDTAHIMVRAQDNQVLSGTAILTTTANALPIITLAPAAAAQSGNPGAIVTYTLSVSHTDVTSHTFDLTLVNNSWPTTITTPIGPRPGNVAWPVTVTIAIPTDIRAYNTDTVYIVAGAQDGMIISDTAILTTTAHFIPGIDLAPTQLARSGSAGEWVTYTLNLTNTGNFTDTFAVDYSGNHWGVQGPLSATLAAWSGMPLFVTVQVPPTATHGLSDTAHLTVTGSGVFAFSDLITTASRQYAVYLPLILK